MYVKFLTSPRDLARSSSAAFFRSQIERFFCDYLVSGDANAPIAVPFGGRDDELAHLDAWLNDGAAPLRLAMTAPPGHGKSVLLVRWIEQLYASDKLSETEADARSRQGLSISPRLCARLDEQRGGGNTMQEVPWEKRRGLNTVWYRNRFLLIRASIDELAAALSSYTHRWEKDVLGRQIVMGYNGVFVFRLRGHSWTIANPEGYESILPAPLGEKELSELMNTRIISYFVSDTSGSTGYQFYDNGKEIEEFFASEGDSGRPAANSKFSSQRRNVKLDDITSIWDFCREFFIEQDAFDPGMGRGYFVNRLAYNPGDTLRVDNFGFQCVKMSENKRWTDTPPVERADYFVPAP